MPAQTSLLIRDSLAKNRTVIALQPPYLPDLPICDYLLFPILRFVPIEIKTVSVAELKVIQKAHIRSVLSIAKCRHKCFVFKGNYCEGGKIDIDD